MLAIKEALSELNDLSAMLAESPAMFSVLYQHFDDAFFRSRLVRMSWALSTPKKSINPRPRLSSSDSGSFVTEFPTTSA